MTLSNALYFTHHARLDLDHELAARSTNKASRCIEARPPTIVTKFLKRSAFPFAKAEFA
jgi:hypothetical protein